MPIKIATAPAGFEQTLERAVTDASAHSNLRFAAAGGAGAGVMPAAKHPAYTMGVDQVAAGSGVSKAVPTSWRAFLVMGQSTVALGEVAASGGQLARDASISEGRLVDRAVEAIQFAEQSAVVAQQDFELRFLHIPGIYVLALWLHGLQDLFVPVLGPGLKTLQFYSEADLFKAIQPAATELQKQTGDQGAARF